MGIGCSSFQNDAKKCETKLDLEQLSIQAFLTTYMFDTGGKSWYKEYVDFKKDYPNIRTLTEYTNNLPNLPLGGTRRQRRQRRRTRRNRFFKR